MKQLNDLIVFLLSSSSEIQKKTQSYFPNLRIVPYVNIKQSCSSNTLKQEGCFQAHLNAWKMIRETNVSSTKFLILENDWTFATSDSYALSIIQKGMKRPEEFIAIGYCGVDMACLQAYIIDKSLTKRLSNVDRCMVKHTGPRHCQIDWFMSSLYAINFFTAKIMYVDNMYLKNKEHLFGSGVIQQNRHGRMLGIIQNFSKAHKPYFHHQCTHAINQFLNTTATK